MRAKLLRFGAVLVVVLGLAAAYQIDQASRRAEAAAAVGTPDNLPLDPGDSKRAGYVSETMVGRAGEQMERLAGALDARGHGRALALGLALGSLAGAGALLLAADRVRG